MENPLAKLADFVRTAFKRKPSEGGVVGIDISSSSIKAVQIRKDHGRALLETYGEIFLGPYGGVSAGQSVQLPPEKMVEALTDLLKGAGITAKRVALAIPLRSSLILLVELPAVGERQINEMIPLEARKYIPVPIAEVMLDWWLIPKKDMPQEEQGSTATSVDADLGLPRAKPAGEVGKVEVLMVAIHNATIKQYQDVVSGAGLVPETIEIETFAAIRAVFGRDMLPTLILDLGASSTKITIVDYGIIRLSHVIPKGSQDITLAISRSQSIPFDQAERVKRESSIMGQTGEKNISGLAGPVIEYIFFEANKVVANYQRKYKRAIARVLLIGGGSLLGGLHEVAARDFEVEVLMGDPFAKVDAPAFLETVLKSAGPEFAVAVGLALRQLQES